MAINTFTATTEMISLACHKSEYEINAVCSALEFLRSASDADQSQQSYRSDSKEAKSFKVELKLCGTRSVKGVGGIPEDKCK